MPAACPRCGQFDMVQRVAGIVASQNSPLSWELRAPPPPGTVAGPARRSGGVNWGCLFLAILITLPVDVLILLALAIALAAVIAVAAVVAVVAIAGYVTYRFLNRHVTAERQADQGRQRAEAHRRYHHALHYWNQLDHCFRCHGVFLPGNEWQYREVTIRGAVAAPGHAWPLAEQLAAYADRVNAPEIVRLEDA